MSKSVKQRLIGLEALVKTLQKSTRKNLSETTAQREARITHLLANPLEFMKYYFPHWASSEFAPFHKRAAEAVINFKNKKNIFAWMIARDMAKTTYWQMMAIHLNCRAIKGMDHGYKTGIWWSKTGEQATEMIRALRLQFEYNKDLIADFGEFKTYAVWSDDKFVTSQGISWKALGKGQSPRGTKEDEKRPDLIIGDDFDDDEECLNDIRLDKTWQWIMGALWPTMDVSSHSLFVALNNKIAEKSLMARIYEIADYKETINLLDKRGKPSWSRHSLADCQYMINKMGTLLAEREYFNNPYTEGKVFRKEWIRYKPMSNLSDYAAIIAYLDPSFKNKKNSDHKSWPLIGLKEGEIHVIKAFCDRASIDAMIAWGYEHQQHVSKNNGVCELWMEEVFLQDLLYKDFFEYAKANRLMVLPINGDTRQKPDKDARISSLSGYFERGAWYFNQLEKDNHHMVNLIHQFTSFQPGHTGIKKDGPDSCEGGVVKLMEKIVQQGATSMGRKPKSKNLY